MGKQPDGTPIGEGDYAASRRFREKQEKFAKEGPVKQKAREAAEAIDSPEGEELEQARKQTAKRDG